MQQSFDLSQAFYRRLPEGLTVGAILGAVLTTASGLMFGSDSDAPTWLMVSALVIAGGIVGSYLGAAWGIVQACCDALLDTQPSSGHSASKANRTASIHAK